MVFSSLFFIFLFLPISLLLYYSASSLKWKNGILILSSLFFYAWGEPVWVVLLLFSSIVDYFHGQIVEKYRGSWQSKMALMSSVIINLGLLALFKYSGMVVESLDMIFGTTTEYRSFSLPIGISFYTFQTISYVVDVYRGEVKAQQSFWKFLMFVSLFHQLVAGPIVRYKDIAQEIEERSLTIEKFGIGGRRFIIGLAKKVIFANTAGALASHFLDGGLMELSMGGHWLGMILFGLQIYYDFSGYSDMAIGLGHMFGFTYQENFRYPYTAQSVTDFWRRWHISLGSFFRDYVYIPLGGNRRFYLRNLFVVWFLTGLWHGASWNFVLWGLYYGLWIAIEKQLQRAFPFFQLPKWIKYVYMLIITTVGWTLFYYEDLSQGVLYMQGFVQINNIWDTATELVLVNNIWFLLCACIGVTPWMKKMGQKIDTILSESSFSTVYNIVIYPVVLILIFVVTFIILMGQTYNPFLYFRF